ncbi:MAG: transcriptional regulator [Oceanicaulis sp.]|mgnify:FL=1|jgi:putative transcriptional regulator|uniref:helix-turn-helix transcriptional regulator n=1 Tax=unclassified Oceanicaulis TaxID=2632123 RepID=UPI000066B0B2|nr:MULTISPECIES: helix-turn-helix transcriptional regulator [unclassified Oceanicaulis]EAP88972.1 transcriptional regulator [Oceanicaulis alexandrii HTCC2633] [Oceanicaulis sp. HTCC2633]MAB69612.1 transcriptional regulator [Oceanicaulis sp.]MBC38401.1 transcriptional regulator [Oceanicaulis sp.]MBG35510.1 transcriptional regulator [Oceanicaulis sp.]HBU63091.1 transcriptional regulator [Oceanicaulis sp.]|tara:strand:+ start:746 stop:961 length:216 start_codon:yes stop_codon:yes gene_type:complete
MSRSGLENAMKALRAEAGLTQADLAARVGVTRKTINTVENGVFTPSALLALKIARALGQPVEQVFWLSDEA